MDGQQHQNPRFRGENRSGFAHSPDVRRNIGEGDHGALRASGGARCINYQSSIIVVAFEEMISGGIRSRRKKTFFKYQNFWSVGEREKRFFEFRKFPAGTKNFLGFTVGEDIRHLIGRGHVVYRHHGITALPAGIHDIHPLRPVLRENSDLRARRARYER